MKTSRILLLTTLIVAMLATAALAQSGAARHGRRGQMAMTNDGGPGARLERMAERLDLTDDQRTAIEALHATAREQGRDVRKDLARLQNTLQGEMLKDDPSEKTVVDLTERMGELRTQLHVIRVKTRLAVREQLTDDQRDQMMLMRKQGRRGGHHRPGRRQDCGFGPGRCWAPDENADR